MKTGSATHTGQRAVIYCRGGHENKADDSGSSWIEKIRQTAYPWARARIGL